MRLRTFGLMAALALVWGVGRGNGAVGGGGNRMTSLITPSQEQNALYVGNRAPLLPRQLVKLPIGAVQPRGWLHEQLRLMAAGFPGHLPEVSHWARFEGSAWASPVGKGQNGWEELPYWLRGYGDLGYVLGDAGIKAEFEKWTNAILASQRPDGYFGPEQNRISSDLWPNMLALYALRTRYEATGDPRILPFMLKYFHWTSTLPKDKYLPGSWQKVRGGDNLDSIYWLYNHTGEKWLLDLASFNHERTLDWTDGIASHHGVDLAQSFREPATYYQQVHDPRFLQATLRDYETYWGTWGQVPGGMYGADENARPGYTGPRQAAETCAMVEAMFSDEILTGITGDPTWADRCEDVAFNSLPAAMTPDFRGLHYLTAPNMIQLDDKNKAPMLQNGGTMLSYDPGEVYRCCQHNAVMGWPYFAEHLWMAAPADGLAAVMYAPSAIRARVGDGTTVSLVETTDYPFDGNVALQLTAPAAVRFPLLLRVPGWCTAPSLQVNGRRFAADSDGGWLRIKRKWKSGDRVALALPMPVRAKVWSSNRNAVSIYRGPLAFSLKIGERTQRYGGTDKWPAVEVFPTTPWNYGLIVDAANPGASFRVVRKPGPIAAQPFTAESTPLLLEGKGKRIPEWRQEANGMVGALQPGPVHSEEPEEAITLIPMGAARLRISAFPQIGSGPEAKRWVAEEPGAAFTYSYLNPGDSPLSLSDAVSPRNSADMGLPRFTWWDHKGTQEWVEYDFQKPRSVRSCDVYWYDDTGHGGVRLPESWRLVWWDGKGWQPVTHAVGDGIKSSEEFGAEIDRFNHLTFDPVETSRIRLLAQLQPGFSGGILAWRVGG